MLPSSQEENEYFLRADLTKIILDKTITNIKHLRYFPNEFTTITVVIIVVVAVVEVEVEVEVVEVEVEVVVVVVRTHTNLGLLSMEWTVDSLS